MSKNHLNVIASWALTGNPIGTLELPLDATGYNLQNEIIKQVMEQDSIGGDLQDAGEKGKYCIEMMFGSIRVPLFERLDGLGFDGVSQVTVIKRECENFECEQVHGVLVIPKGPNRRWRLPDRYQLHKIIGTGSHGSVCEGMDAEKNHLVAIKRFGHIFEDLGHCRYILREMTILNKVKHPNVVQLYSVVMPESVQTFSEIFLIMELCDSSLRKVFRTDVSLSMEHVKALIVSLLTGLQHLHSIGISHRNLTPTSCFVNDDCTVKIGDVGFARSITSPIDALPKLPDSPPSSPRIVNPSAGTKLRRHHKSRRMQVYARLYQAPEIFLLQNDYTESVDIWSVGCIYAELLQMLPSTLYDDRCPLFPNDRKQALLNSIFDVIGTPSDEALEALEHCEMKKLVLSIVPRKGSGFSSQFPDDVDPANFELLEKMISFNPSTRISACGALQSDVLGQSREPSKESDVDNKAVVDLGFRWKDLSELELRTAFGNMWSKDI